jgi:hypothetical protein
MAEVGEHNRPSKREALSSNPKLPKKKNPNQKKKTFLTMKKTGPNSLTGEFY